MVPVIVDCRLHASSLQTASGMRGAERCSSTVSNAAAPHVDAVNCRAVEAGQVVNQYVVSGPGAAVHDWASQPMPLVVPMNVCRPAASEVICVTVPEPTGRCWKCRVKVPDSVES